MQSNERKVILATNYAETSVTIDGVLAVIDSGLHKVMTVNPERQAQCLSLEHISRSAADQRRGRAGRQSSGLCVRLYREDDYLHAPAQPVPEISRSTLEQVVLRLKAFGVRDVLKFPLPTAPDPCKVL